MTAPLALALVAAWHAAFQLTVSLVVYPTLRDRAADAFAAAHDVHSRRILALVVPTYAGVVAVVGWVLVAGPRTPSVLVAVVAQLVVLAVTALAAAPTHGRLGRDGPRPHLLRRLTVVDAVRSAAAVVGLVAAVLAVA